MHGPGCVTPQHPFPTGMRSITPIRSLTQPFVLALGANGIVWQNIIIFWISHSVPRAAC